MQLTVVGHVLCARDRSRLIDFDTFSVCVFCVRVRVKKAVLARVTQIRIQFHLQ